jgi:hypothetical protein
MTPAAPKYVVSLAGTGVTNGATATQRIDTLGHDYARISVVMGTADVVSNKPSVLRLLESDDTVVTNFATWAGSLGGTDFTIPSADTSNPNVYTFGVDCRYRKRYLLLTVSPRTTQETVVVTELGGGHGSWSEELPTTTTKASAHLIVNL